MAFGYTLGAYIASATDTMTVPAPAGQTSTDLTFMFLSSKNVYGTGAVTWGTPDGWTRLQYVVGGPIGSAPDIGSVNMAVFFKYGVTGDVDVTFLTPGVTTVQQGQMIRCTRAVNEIFAFKGSYGIDSTLGVNYTVDSPAIGNTNAEVGDTIFAVSGLNTDDGTISAPSIYLAGLVVTGATTIADNVTTLGDDSRLLMAYSTVDSGTEQTDPALFGFTNASSSSGTTLFLRINTVADPVVSVDPDDEFHVDPNYQITITGLEPYDQYKIERRSSTGEYATTSVRGGDYQAIPTTSAVLSDFEFHFTGRDATVEQHYYDITVYTAGIFNATITSGPHTPVNDRVAAAIGDSFSTPYRPVPVTYISSPIAPSVNTPVIVMQFDTYTRAGAVLGNHKVLGRRNPVVVTDVSAGMTGSFTILAMNVAPGRTDNKPDANARQHLVAASYNTASNAKKIEEFFQRGDILYLKHLSAVIAGTPDFYFVIDSLDIKRINRIAEQNILDVSTSDGYPVYEITVHFIETDRPPTLVQAVTVTWDDVREGNSSWTTVLAGVSTPNTTWLDVLLDGE